MCRTFLILDLLFVITIVARSESKLLVFRNTGINDLQKRFQLEGRWKRDQTNFATSRPDLRPMQITSMQSLRELLNHMRNDHFKPVQDALDDDLYKFSTSNLGTGTSYAPLRNKNFDNLLENPPFFEDVNKVHQTNKIENREETRKNSARKKYAVKKHIFIGAGGCWVIVFILLCICKKKTPKTDFQIKIDATPTCGNAACLNHRQLHSAPICSLGTSSFHPATQATPTVSVTSANGNRAGAMSSSNSSMVSIQSSMEIQNDLAAGGGDLPPSYDEALANFTTGFPPSYSSVMNFSSSSCNAAKDQ